MSKMKKYEETTTKTMSEVDGKITAVKQRTEKITSSTDLMLDDFPPPPQQQQPMLPPTSLRHVSDAYLVQYPPSELSSTKSNVGSNKSYKSNASTVRGGSGGSDDRSSNCSEKTTDQLNEYDLPPGTKFGFDDQLDRMSVGSRQSSASSRAKIRSNLHSGFDDNLNREVLDRTDQLDDELERMSLGGMSSRKVSSKQNSSRLHDRFDERLGGLTHYGLNNNRHRGLLGFQNSFWGDGEDEDEEEDSFFSKAFRDDFFKDTTRLMRRNNLLGGVDSSSRGLRAQKQQQLQEEQQKLEAQQQQVQQQKLQQLEAQQLHVQQQKLEVQKLEEQQLQIQQQQLQQLQQLQIEQQQLEKLQKKQRMMRDKETADYEDSGIFSETSSIQTDRSLLDSVHSEKNSKQQQQQQQQLKQLQEKQLQVQQQQLQQLQQLQIKQQQLEKLQKSQRMMSNKEDYEDCGISSETSSIQTDRSLLDSGHSEKNSKQEQQQKQQKKQQHSSGKQGTFPSEKFQVSIDVTGFKPDELVVKTEGNLLIVCAKAKDDGERRMVKENKLVTKQFRQEFELPAEVNPLEVVSSLGSDGLLKVEAPISRLTSSKSSDNGIC